MHPAPVGAYSWSPAKDTMPDMLALWLLRWVNSLHLGSDAVLMRDSKMSTSGL